jgi:hypothetical protein
VALKTCELLNIILSALVTGVFWGPWVGLTRSIATFDPPAFLAIGYRLNVNLAPLMSVLMPLALASAVPTLVLSYDTLPATFALTLAAVGLFVLALIVTVAIEVPIAVQIKSWSASSLPDDWRRLRDRWASVHRIRVVSGIAGLALLAAGAIYP